MNPPVINPPVINLTSAGIVVALRAEAAVLTRQPLAPECLLPLADGCGLWLGGMGPAAARTAAMALVDAGAQGLATFGVAGALDASLRSGMLLCPRQILDEYGCVYPTDTEWRERLQQRLVDADLPTIIDVSLLSLPEPLCTPAAKRAAQQRYMASAVDLESAAVASVADSLGLPFIALRAVVDERDDEIPQLLHSAIDPWGQPRWPQLLALLVRQPWLLARLPALASRMNAALGALRAVATVAPQLEARTLVRWVEAG
ncbi:MAG: hypothetical protein JWP80_3210 [Pseudomonas sp.]|nr:hypothetical protein [Pseudomonas sp.]